LLEHQLWADAAHWGAVAAHAPARDDRALRQRLHHIHLVQRTFVWIVGDRSVPFASSTPDDFATFDDLRAFARGSHDEIRRTLESVSAARAAESIDAPWFRNPPLSLTVVEALTQMAMHSQWHRGQNAARLRELGGEPPTTDLIVWYWKARPSAQL
jgi:uncharacterized damage-inducible protein DinB